MFFKGQLRLLPGTEDPIAKLLEEFLRLFRLGCLVLEAENMMGPVCMLST